MKKLKTAIQIKDTHINIVSGMFTNGLLTVEAMDSYVNSKPNGESISYLDSVMLSYLIEKHMSAHGIKKTELVFILNDAISKISNLILPLTKDEQVEEYFKLNAPEANNCCDYLYQIDNDKAFSSIITLKLNSLEFVEEIVNRIKLSISHVEVEENTLSNALWPVRTEEKASILSLRTDGLHMTCYDKGLLTQHLWIKSDLLEHRVEEEKQFQEMRANFYHMDILESAYNTTPLLMRIVDRIYQITRKALLKIEANVIEEMRYYFINEVFASPKLMNDLTSLHGIQFSPAIREIAGFPVGLNQQTFVSTLGGLIDE